MFTGIIQNIGTFNRQGGRVSIESTMDLSDVAAGDSVAVNGVCLTTLENRCLIFDLGPETLAKTTLGGLINGSSVHLEKAMRLSDRLGGHLVQGHVDGVGEVLSRREIDGSLELVFEATKEITKYCVPKGSVTIEGVSLTLNQVDKQSFGVCLVPHTLEKTVLGALQPGAHVNIENDLIVKTIAHLYANAQ
ncbi:MAG: riboflavin synthase [Myxococcota bacterium]